MFKMIPIKFDKMDKNPIFVRTNREEESPDR